jgi:hypothetical protein
MKLRAIHHMMVSASIDIGQAAEWTHRAIGLPGLTRCPMMSIMIAAMAKNSAGL